MTQYSPDRRPATHGRQRRFRAVVAGFALAVIAADAHAGGGPENVLLVVNATSPGSVEVANHYARLRDLPPSNVLHLDYRGPKEHASARVFREQVLAPILKAIEDRGLGLQIDVVAYSTDFPWRIDFTKEYPEEVKLAKQLKPFASLTGATYLNGFVLAKSPGLVDPTSNWYLAAGGSQAGNRARCQQLGACPSRALRSRYTWQADGARVAKAREGRRYLLSTMLGVTTGRGLTTEEVIASLRRSAIADTSPPTGTIYYAQNSNVRSKTRHGCYAEAVALLRGLGADAQVTTGVLPPRGSLVAGMTLGAANLPLEGRELTIERGAICEHLTSLGGVLHRKSAQTPLTDLIRAGAAGACGTVVEPYAIQAKFPLPSLQVHYRRGCSLAEAFYQSVASPYQLLVVGDPLCQPWAERPRLSIAGWPGASAEPAATETPAAAEADLSQLGLAQLGLAKATPKAVAAPEPASASAESEPSPSDQPPPPGLTVRPTVQAPGGGTPYWELFVDGRLRMRLPSGVQATIPAEAIGPGWHEVRCVGISGDPIEAQTRRVTGWVAPPAENAEAGEAATEPTEVKLEAYRTAEGVRVRVEAANAERVTLLHHARPVGEVVGESGELLLAPRRVGAGPIRLQAIAEPGGRRSPLVWVEPLL